MTITLQIPDQTLSKYSNFIEAGTGVPGPQTAEEWSLYITDTIINNYMTEKFGTDNNNVEFI